LAAKKPQDKNFLFIGKKWRLTWFDFTKWHPTFAEKHMKTFFEVIRKKGLNDLCGRHFVGKSRTKFFSGKFGEIRTKILRTQKNLPAPTSTK